MKNLLLVLVLGLSLSSCKKEPLEEVIALNTLIVNGEVYNIDSCLVTKYTYDSLDLDKDYQTTIILMGEKNGWLRFYLKTNEAVGNHNIYSKDSNNDVFMNDLLFLIDGVYDYNTIESVITDEEKVVGGLKLVGLSKDRISGSGGIYNEGVSIKYNFNLTNVRVQTITINKQINE